MVKTVMLIDDDDDYVSGDIFCDFGEAAEATRRAKVNRSDAVQMPIDGQKNRELIQGILDAVHEIYTRRDGSVAVSFHMGRYISVKTLGDKIDNDVPIFEAVMAICREYQGELEKRCQNNSEEEL